MASYINDRENIIYFKTWIMHSGQFCRQSSCIHSWTMKPWSCTKNRNHKRRKDNFAKHWQQIKLKIPLQSLIQLQKPDKLTWWTPLNLIINRFWFFWKAQPTRPEFRQECKCSSHHPKCFRNYIPRLLGTTTSCRPVHKCLTAHEPNVPFTHRDMFHLVRAFLKPMF